MNCERQPKCHELTNYTHLLLAAAAEVMERSRELMAAEGKSNCDGEK